MPQKRTQRKLTQAQRRAQEAIDNIARSSAEPTRKVLDFLLSGSHDIPFTTPGQSDVPRLPSAHVPLIDEIDRGPNPDQTQTRPRPNSTNNAIIHSKQAVNQDQTQTRAKGGSEPIAPQKDFNRRANSIERQLLPAGYFLGSSKSLYDALYLRTRGAVQPVRMIKATRRDLMKWTGIKNIKTINANINRLTNQKLLKHLKVNGDQTGSLYEVFLPEEINQAQTQPRPDPDLDQKMDSDQTQKMVWVGSGKLVENTASSDHSKTFIKTHTDDETHTLDEFTKAIADAARSVVGGKLSASEQERKRWKELGEAIASELQNAAQRTGTISSVPAFFNEHLRRRLTKIEQQQPSADEKLAGTSPEERKVATKKEPSRRATHGEVKSKFLLEECRRYAEHLHTTGQGITNPGGYATTIHRTGEADEMIEKFLRPPAPPAPSDASQCPDCRGTGWWYPKGPEMGVARCKHERLVTKDRGDAS